MHMAEEVKVRKSSSEQPERRGGGVARRGEHFPGFFSMSPRDFFAMSPFSLARRMSDEMDRWFGGEGWGERGIWSPAVEVREQDNNLVVCADLPGLKKEDVKVEVTDQGLVIQGERKREHEERSEEGVYRSERSYGRFYRVIPLPEGASVDQANANFKDGVLEVRVPVPAAQRSRREIPISETRTRTSGGGA
jgi:HSP20 family protein